MIESTVKPVLSGHSKIDKTKILMTNGSLMKVESIAECSPWSILQCFWLVVLKTILVFFLSGRLSQVLLYVKFTADVKSSQQCQDKNIVAMQNKGLQCGSICCVPEYGCSSG